MRRYDAISGILLILSIIGFTLAAPVPVQEEFQACVDAVHIPHDVITVLGKRGLGDLWKVVKDFFATSERPIESSDAHASSSSAPPVPGHGSTNVQAPAPKKAPSTAGLLMEPSSPSSVQGNPESSKYGGSFDWTPYLGADPARRPPPRLAPQKDPEFDWLHYWSMHNPP